MLPNLVASPGLRVIGIYGISGCGKSYLLNELREKFGEDNDFAFYEGSAMIDQVVPGGLDAFKKMDNADKQQWRASAINRIATACLQQGRTGVVTGHLTFWDNEDDENGIKVHTHMDTMFYSHIIHLNVPAEEIQRRRTTDSLRSRHTLSTEHLAKWQEFERQELRKLCRGNGILFTSLSSSSSVVDKAADLLQDFHLHSEPLNQSRADSRLDEILRTCSEKVDTVLVLDADRTLAPTDTGKLLWRLVADTYSSDYKEFTLKDLFSGPSGYSYTAFRQAMLLYEEIADDQKFDYLCAKVASEVNMHPEFTSFLWTVLGTKHVTPVVVTCGIRLIWEKVLERKGFAGTIKVIGGCRFEDKFVVTASVKARLVQRLQDEYRMSVWAFGDSILDIDMMRKADRAVVVVGQDTATSRTMEAALMQAIEQDGLELQQVVLPPDAPTRVDVARIPPLDLTDPRFIKSICHLWLSNIKVTQATTRNAAKVLMTPTRDARIAGPRLREAHQRIGWYLATELLTDIIGTEGYSIPHVQGHATTGYRLRDEGRTLIIALMRGGEPMALGVNEASPSAMFFHAKESSDIEFSHIRGKRTVLLVDSVVNSGNSMLQFVEHIRKFGSNIRIVITAGVVQAEVISNSNLGRKIEEDDNIRLIALRVSDNKFTGSGGTDTGNRLFNTTHLER